jgi:2-polyprenyl-3-methyl-5-hydroxy-6-metoxy-1,4-benzoquinol methylase
VTAWTKEAIEKLLASEDFKYHRVPLPFGLATPGQDRSDTAALVLPNSLAGKSVLDVGCALGYFSFEAERRGAARVVGIELRDDRFRQANRLKDVLGSRVEFVQRNVLTDDLGGPFDIVLLLNVIHHLAEPMSALRRLAAATKERLVVEFPTFRDEKFARSAGIRFPGRYDALPLIGVSSLAKGTDQTFVFTPEAIRRVLTDHAKLFARVEFLKSPMKGRMIAVAEKA